MSKHTPGPWGTEESLPRGDDGHISVWVSHHGNGITEIVRGENLKERRANARLIAAAPEMLEALNRAHLEIIGLLNDGDFKTNITLDLGYIVDAIAKAEGA